MPDLRRRPGRSLSTDRQDPALTLAARSGSHPAVTVAARSHSDPVAVCVTYLTLKPYKCPFLQVDLYRLVPNTDVITNIRYRMLQLQLLALICFCPCFQFKLLKYL